MLAERLAHRTGWARSGFFAPSRGWANLLPADIYQLS
jgi:hypothetical protein